MQLCPIKRQKMNYLIALFHYEKKLYPLRVLYNKNWPNSLILRNIDSGEQNKFNLSNGHLICKSFNSQHAKTPVVYISQWTFIPRTVDGPTRPLRPQEGQHRQKASKSNTRVATKRTRVTRYSIAICSILEFLHRVRLLKRLIGPVCKCWT